MTDEQNARDIADIKRGQDAYVRRDVYDAEQKTMLLQITAVEKDNLELKTAFEKAEERRAADRRLWLTSLVLPIIVAIILIYVQTKIGAA